MSNLIMEVQKTVQQYLDFAYEGGVTLPECFYENCHMHTSEGNKHLNFPVTVLVGSESPASKGEARQDQIILIDIAGSNMAYAKVTATHNPHYYTDYHSLVKHEGKWRIVSKLWATATDPFEVPFLSVKDQEVEIGKIQKTLTSYFEGIYEADVEKILLPFANDAEMFYTHENGKLSAVPVTVLREMLKNVVSPREKGEPHHDFIQHIEMCGPTTAMVKLNCALAPAYFTDYLFMAVENSEWKIVSKTTMTIKK